MNTNEFLGKLKKDEINEDLIEKIKRDAYPLVMWGMGDVGSAVLEYLKINNISVSAIWVDEQYLNKNLSTTQGYQIDTLEQLCKEYKEFSVILGHSHYELGQDLCKKYSFIKNVYYVSSVHYAQYNLVNFADIECEKDRFINLCNNLEDNKSVLNLIAYLNTKMTGNVEHIFDVYESEMSFFDNDVFKVSEDEVFLDVGAYDGDTIRAFLDKTNGLYKKIIAIEPDTNSYIRLSEFVAKNRMKNVLLSKMGLWNSRVDLEFETGNEQLSGLVSENDSYDSAHKIIIYAERADRIFDEPISFIKINYFSGVKEAIEGCEEIIKINHPKMAIDVGFNIYNILLLFEYIESLKLDYKFYLRFNRAMSSTFTLYVV